MAIGVAADGGVPGEDVWVGEVGEDDGAVGEVGGVGDGGGGDEAAGGEGVGDETGDDHLGLDLLEVGQSAASVQEGEERVSVERRRGRE